jgi:hypothetical protein
MNLDNLNLVELNAQEVQEVDGGWIAAMLGAYLAWEIVGNPKASWEAFKKGYDAQI